METEPHYRPLETLPGLADRHRYLTSETAEVLFDRALWLELMVPEGSQVDGLLEFPATFASGGSHRVRVDRPRLVLFEYGSGEDVVSERAGTAPDILKTGFIYLDVWFAGTQGGSQQPVLGDLLELNEGFRYWQCPWEGHGKGGYLDLLQGHLGIPSAGAAHEAKADPYFDRWARLLAHPLRVEARGGRFEWLRLFPDDWARSAHAWALGDRPPDFATAKPEAPRTELEELERERARLRCSRADEGRSTGWIVHADNRAFVWTCAILPDQPVTKPVTKPATVTGCDTPISGSPTDTCSGMSDDPWDMGSWVQLLNVDKPRDEPPSNFERTWTKARTYWRWWHSGTAYGFCSHAGAMLSGPGDLTLWRHFARMYFDQVLLLLYVRVATFRFSRRLSEVSAGARGARPKDAQELAEQFQNLRYSFALFTNLYQFPLLSSQQQAVEMYALAREHLDIKALYEEVREEIHATDDFLNGKAQLDQTRAANRLGVIAGVAAAIGLSLALNQISPWEKVDPRAQWWSLLLWLVPFATVLFVAAIFSRALVNWLSRAEDLFRNRRGPG